MSHLSNFARTHSAAEEMADESGVSMKSAVERAAPNFTNTAQDSVPSSGGVGVETGVAPCDYFIVARVD